MNDVPPIFASDDFRVWRQTEEHSFSAFQTILAEAGGVKELPRVLGDRLRRNCINSNCFEKHLLTQTRVPD
jgi:hypothetical protein